MFSRGCLSGTRPCTCGFVRGAGYAFGSSVIRITDTKPGEVFKPLYSTVQAWNKDESLMVLYRNGSRQGHYLLDGHTYQEIRQLDILPSDLEDIFWSHTDPNVLFYSSNSPREHGRLYSVNVETSKRELIKDFSILPLNPGALLTRRHRATRFIFKAECLHLILIP